MILLGFCKLPMSSCARFVNLSPFFSICRRQNTKRAEESFCHSSVGRSLHRSLFNAVQKRPPKPQPILQLFHFKYFSLLYLCTLSCKKHRWGSKCVLLKNWKQIQKKSNFRWFITQSIKWTTINNYGQQYYCEFTFVFTRIHLFLLKLRCKLIVFDRTLNQRKLVFVLRISHLCVKAKFPLPKERFF